MIAARRDLYVEADALNFTSKGEKTSATNYY